MIEIKERNKYCNQFIDTFHFQLNWCAEVHQTFLEEEPKILIGLNIFKFEEKMSENASEWLSDPDNSYDIYMDSLLEAEF